jgi:hypothetical protein
MGFRRCIPTELLERTHARPSLTILTAKQKMEREKKQTFEHSFFLTSFLSQSVVVKENSLQLCARKISEKQFCSNNAQQNIR